MNINRLSLVSVNNVFYSMFNRISLIKNRLNNRYNFMSNKDINLLYDSSIRCNDFIGSHLDIMA